MKVRILTIFLFLYCCALASSCNNCSESLQEGDLLFQNLNCSYCDDKIKNLGILSSNTTTDLATAEIRLALNPRVQWPFL